MIGSDQTGGESIEDILIYEEERGAKRYDFLKNNFFVSSFRHGSSFGTVINDIEYAST